MKRNIIDLHIHTLYSPCCESKYSIEDVVRTALAKGIHTIGISDHCHLETNLEAMDDIIRVIEETRVRYPGLRILFGLEADLLTVDGELSVPDEFMRKTDYIIVGIHHILAGGICLPVESKGKVPLMKGKSELFDIVNNFSIQDLINDWYSALMKVITDGRVNILAHPVQWPFLRLEDCVSRKITNDISKEIPTDMIEKLAYASIQKNIYWEINNDYLQYGESFRRIFRKVADCGVRFSLGSDAHELDAVGRLDNAFHFMRMCNIDNILNNPDEILRQNVCLSNT